MKLYKYMTPATAKSFLKEPLLRISPSSCLNDPFEIKLSTSTKRQMDTLSNEKVTANIEEYMNNHGVISLTETYDSLLMWSHYASDHKGIVVEFAIDDESPFSLFHYSKPHEESGAVFDSVKYRKKREYPDKVTGQNIQSVGPHYFLTKSDEWIYEKEHRYIIPFTMANKILVDLRYPEAKKTLKEWGISYEEEKEEALVNITKQVLNKQNYDALATIFQKSHKNGFMFFLSIEESCISRLFLGINSDDLAYSSLIDNAYNGSPYVSYRSIIDNKYHGVLKGKEHPNRYEISFVPYNQESNYGI